MYYHSLLSMPSKQLFSCYNYLLFLLSSPPFDSPCPHFFTKQKKIMRKIFFPVLVASIALLTSCNNTEQSTDATTTDSSTSPATTPPPASNPADAVTVAPDLYSVIKDSAGIRVLDVHYKPGDSSAMHSHPDVVLYVVEGGKSEFTMQDGSKQVHELKNGDAMIMPGGTHSVKNIGSSATKAVLVEVSRPNNAGPSIPADMDPIKVSPGMHQLIKDTLNIRAMRFTAKPGASTAKHSHPDHAIYVIEGGRAEFTAENGTKQVRELPKGTVLINPATTHTFKNVGNAEIKVLVVEVKRPAQ